MAQINSDMKRYLESLGYSGAVPDMWKAALVSETGSSLNCLSDLEKDFLTAQGYDNWYDYLGSKGYAGSLNDRWKAAVAADDVFATVDILILDASSGEVTTDPNFNGKLTPSVDEQAGTYTFVSGLGTANSYAMLPANTLTSTGQSFKIDSGIVALAIDPEETFVPAGSYDYSMTLTVVDKSTFATIGQIVIERNTSGTFVYQAPDGVIKTGYQGGQISLWFNAGTGDWGVGYVNTSGSDVVSTKGTYTSTDAVPVISVKEQIGGSGTDAGKDLTIRMQDLASEITAPVPVGAVDIYGTVI